MNAKGIILSAGRGSRMGKATDEGPKCLLPLGDKRLLDWQMAAMTDAGISEIAVVTGYQSNVFRSEPIKKFNNARWNETNMVYSLMQADEWLNDNVCIVSYGDIFYYSSIVNDLISNKGDIAIAYDVNWKSLWSARFDDPLSDAETFRIDEENIVTEIGNSTDNIDEIQGQYMGLIRISPKGWKIISQFLAELPQEESSRLDVTSLLQKLIELGQEIRGVPNITPWGEIDFPQDMVIYEKFLSEGKI